MISQANKNIMSVLALYEYNKDSEDFFENLAMLYHNEISRKIFTHIFVYLGVNCGENEFEYQ